MIRLDTGEKIELHIHNTKFDDATNEVIVHADSETYFIGVDRVSYYWFHKDSTYSALDLFCELYRY
jgi:hypothetical protein